MSPPDRIIRFIAKEDSKTYYGQPIQSGDIGLLYHTKALLTAHTLSASPLAANCSVTATIRTVAKLLSPLTASEIRTMRGMGKQYGAPGAAIVKPEVAVMFFKPTTSLQNPGDPIVIPLAAKGMKNVYEGELCVVLAKTGKDIPVERAMEYVGWYCVCNDVSSLKQTTVGGQWGVGKSYDSWCPVGPCLIARDQIRDPQALRLTTTVNGILKQDTNTFEMVLSVAELVSRLSQGVTLEAGSIILTGTPPPLDRKAEKHPWFMEGDDVRVEIEGCGTLINHVVEEGESGARAKL